MRAVIDALENIFNTVAAAGVYILLLLAAVTHNESLAQRLNRLIERWPE